MPGASSRRLSVSASSLFALLAEVDSLRAELNAGDGSGLRGAAERLDVMATQLRRSLLPEGGDRVEQLESFIRDRGLEEAWRQEYLPGG